MTGLPQGWAETTLGEILYFQYGKSLSSEKRAGGSVAVYGSNGIVGRHNEAITSGPTLVIGRKGSIGEVHFSKTGCFPIDTTYFVDRFDAVDPRFALAILQVLPLKEMNRASAIPGLNREEAHSLQLPLPPLPEQRRIVRKLDTLSARSTTARTHLTALEKLVERYKSGVLGLELSGVPLGNEADEQNTQPITNDNERGAWTFEALPTHWVWTGFKAFLENQTDSYRKLPQKDYQSEGEYPVIDQGVDLIGGYSNDATLLLPAQPPYIIFGDHTRCVKFFEAPFVQGADGVKVFHAGKDVDIRFAYWALKGLQLPDKGYSRHAKFLKESYFPRPPIDEQREIVRRIEAAFAKIDRLKAEASAALKLLGHLESRILAKAFAGDLVPQDPNDEPARDLLARIIEARATAPKGKRRRTVATD